MKTTFSFDNIDNIDEPYHEYIHNISSNIILHLRRINNSYATLYATNERGCVIKFPDEIIVWRKESENKKVIQMIHANGYVLCWTDDYTIEFNDKVELEITNKRVWDINIV